MSPISRTRPKESAKAAAIGCIVGGAAPERLRVVLGSCVGIAVWDPATKAGALAHCLLPEGHEPDAPPAKFVRGALAPLIECALQHGARPGALLVKLAGGASMFTGCAKGNGLGVRNLVVARHEIAACGLRITGESTGGDKGRVMELDLATGKASVKIIGEEPVEI